AAPHPEQVMGACAHPCGVSRVARPLGGRLELRGQRDCLANPASGRQPRHERGSMSYETLLYEHTEHVVTLTYNRPHQHNAVNRRMNAELHDAWQRFRYDDDAFVLVITGAGETTFCAGWDLQDAAELTELGDYDAYRVSLHNSPGECGYTRKADIFKPVIPAVSGYAVAAGVAAAVVADIRSAAQNAEVGA